MRWRWLSPMALLEMVTVDWSLARRWGADDIAIMDADSREMATGTSLSLLHPLTHRRYWAAARAALKE